MVPVSINGDINQNSIPVTDRGFLFGESVYEVMLIHNNKPFHLEAHLARLEKNFYTLCQHRLDIMQIKNWIIAYLQDVQMYNCQTLYIQITSGNMSMRNHLPNLINPTCILHQTYSEPIKFEAYKKGFRAITIPDTRSSLSQLKTNHLALNTNGLRLAAKSGYDDAIFVKHGYLTEAASSNLFIVNKNILITPPTDGIVNGLTRQEIIKLAKKAAIPCQVRPIHSNELQFASEVFLSSSVKLLKPISEIQSLYHNPAPAPIWEKLFNLYIDLIHDYTIDNATTY